MSRIPSLTGGSLAPRRSIGLAGGRAQGSGAEPGAGQKRSRDASVSSQSAANSATSQLSARFIEQMLDDLAETVPPVADYDALPDPEDEVARAAELTDQLSSIITQYIAVRGSDA